MAYSTRAKNTKIDINVYVAFVIRRDTHPELDAFNLQATMESLFENLQRKEHSADVNGDSFEVVYSIQRPVMASDREHEDFFEKLAVLFEETKRLSPHFTKIADDQQKVGNK